MKVSSSLNDCEGFTSQFVSSIVPIEIIESRQYSIRLVSELGNIEVFDISKDELRRRWILPFPEVPAFSAKRPGTPGDL
jgi:hypothetical protein